MRTSGCTVDRAIYERRIAQLAGQCGALVAILEQLSDDMKAYHPDMHPVVRANLDLFTVYKDTLVAQPANQARARAIIAEIDSQGADA
ncbi:hypothetical protein GGR34_003736 [Microvirga flocculans]|uniref:Uncharacterized protein n=1 Tax=Microvirga flocculans TaxID=217168 RepID=A0A7W6IIF0_9HYPH|nr:hypothetical protein [Microvirga flocculans]MBB4042051.1 hypothetical protein [Microvirga flocculans]